MTTETVQESTPGSALERALADYARRWPDEATLAAQFAALQAEGGRDGDHGGNPGGDPYRRERLAGHFTGSAFVISADGARTALMHHRKLDRWLQPGGHADGQRDLAGVALREAEEETGLTGLVVEAVLFDLDRHAIPARQAEPEHWHYDVRFLVRATGSQDFVVNAESLALAWRPVRDVAERPAYDPSLRRMARKWLARGAA